MGVGRTQQQARCGLTFSNDHLKSCSTDASSSKGAAATLSATSWMLAGCRQAIRKFQQVVMVIWR